MFNFVIPEDRSNNNFTIWTASKWRIYFLNDPKLWFSVKKIKHDLNNKYYEKKSNTTFFSGFFSPSL